MPDDTREGGMIFVSMQNYNQSEQRRRRLLATMAGGARRLLDVGSGDGFIASGLTRLAKCVIAVDLFPTHGGTGLVRLQIDRTGNYPFRDDAFDVAPAFEVIEHCPEPRRVLREIARVLQPGGLFVLTTPNYKNFQRRLGLRRVWGRPRLPQFPMWFGGDDEEGTHFREFEPAELTTLLSECGFTVDPIRGDYIGFALWRGRYTIRLGCGWLGALLPGWSFDLLVHARRL